MSSKGTSRAQNSAKNKASVRGNPDKIKPYRFQPGQSGNPGGRPKKLLLTDAYRDILERPAVEVLSPELMGKVNAAEDATVAEVIALQMAMAAIGGDVKAASQIGDRTEGKPAQTVTVRQDEFSGKSDEELEFFADHGYWPDQKVNTN